jgi:hypothetical protein
MGPTEQASLFTRGVNYTSALHKVLVLVSWICIMGWAGLWFYLVYG